MLVTQSSGKENPKKATAVLKWPEANSMFSQPGSCKILHGDFLEIYPLIHRMN